MEKLRFQRTKYGKELLIDACDESELELLADTMVPNFYILAFVQKGHGTYYLDTASIPLQDYSVLFIKPGQVNKVDAAHFERCHLMFFEGDFLDEFFNDKDFIFKFDFFHNPELPSYLQLPPAQFQAYYNLAQEVRAELREQTPESPHILRSIIYYLLVRLNQAYARAYGTSGHPLSHPTLLAFLRLLEKHIKAQRTVAAYAERLHISRVQLNNLCQQYFAKTARQIIQERAMAEIKKALKYSTLSLSEIAYDFNFSAPSHFSRFVKQMTGHSPQAFKDHLSNW
ncbi:MAG: AraC family transcriptional regulator [Phaeodactylibacter sp.]|uniref:helix-turn-helix domain-containing protein n=1 Tax=Phaeodactylibacter sp. TaxID=1940289 RepID=UPI0032F06BCC